MNSFEFNKNSTILIYGYGKIGKQLYAKLIKDGYKVAGFIDKNAKKSNTIGDHCLITLEEMNDVLIKHIIVLTFQNILEQERIAGILYEKGANKIIYLNRNNTKMYEKCFKAYNNLVFGETINDFEFPYTNSNIIKKNDMYYCQTGESIIIEVPSPLIFSAKKDQMFKNEKQDDALLKEKNIVAFNKYNAACELILTGTTKFFKDFKDYLDIADGTERSVKEFLHDRVLLFDMMLKEYKQKGIAFFRNSPCMAEWNPKGYFNLIDGHHRAAFLVNNLNYDIPIKISESDYRQWYNTECVKTCMEYIEKHNIEKIYTPIIHPAFFNMESMTENRGRRTSVALFNFFGREDISEYRVLDMHSNLSYYSQMFTRIGVKKVVSMEKRKLFFDLAKLLNRLHYIVDVDMRNIDISEIDERESFDIVVLANDIHLDFNTKKTGEFCLKKIDELTSKYLIWRSHMDAEAEKKYILENSSFKKYHFMNMEVVEGKLVEAGVYEK